MKPMRHIAAVFALMALPVTVDASALAPELMARLLIASDLADACPHVVQRKEGRDHREFVAEGVVQLINENDVVMADFVKVTQDWGLEEMNSLKLRVLAERGIRAQNTQDLCFFARQIVDTDDDIGRFLERR